MSEPVTALTDYALAVLTAWLAMRLFTSREMAVRLWAAAFVALAVGAFLGGTWHGFLQSDLLWKATVLSVGVATFCMVAGSAFATLRGNALQILAAIKLAAFSAWMLFHDEFIYVVIDSGVAFAAVAALHLWRFNGWILAGVAVSVLAAVVQASGIALHQHFNHNDLYHVVQMAAMVLLYRGARLLVDRRRSS